jgi:1-deoxy-D-xylulose-5-phosphate synthase
MRPVVAMYSTFLQRAYDQLMHDVGILGLPVVLAVDRADLVGEDGETHQGLYDTQFLSSVPGLEIWAPASFEELRRTLASSLASAGPGENRSPVAIRYPRGTEGAYRGCYLGVTRLCEGEDATIVTYGMTVNTALEAARDLEGRGVRAGVVKITRLKPLEADGIRLLLQGRVYLLEENAGILCRYLPGVPLNTGDRYIPHGTPEELLRYCGIDAKSVTDRICHDCQA